MEETFLGLPPSSFLARAAAACVPVVCWGFSANEGESEVHASSALMLESLMNMLSTGELPE